MRAFQHVLFLSLALIAGCVTLRSGYREVPVEIEVHPPVIDLGHPVPPPKPKPHFNPEDKVA